MGADEIGTLAALKALRREVVDPAIAEHNGRIVKTTGDGMLVEFASAVDAVNCAMSVQGKMVDRNGSEVRPVLCSTISENEHRHGKNHVRIGINTGDIIIDGDDIFGDGVNVAARVENECGRQCVPVRQRIVRLYAARTAAALTPARPSLRLPSCRSRT
jgi:adenylate cyclase